MRLIDADALKKEVDNFQNCYNGWSDTYDKAYIIEAIEEAPTIDAVPIEHINLMNLVEVVRCKECKHGTYCEEAEMYICNANDQDLYEAEHFCSYGERRE